MQGEIIFNFFVDTNISVNDNDLNGRKIVSKESKNYNFIRRLFSDKTSSMKLRWHC